MKIAVQNDDSALFALLFFVLALLAVGAYFFVALYVVAPLKIRRRQTKPRDVQFRSLELTELPEMARLGFFTASRFLAHEGFRSVGTATSASPRTRQNSFLSLWRHEANLDSAQIIGVVTPARVGGVRAVIQVTFRTEFTDDTAIVTSNTSSPGVFPRDPKVAPIRVPGIVDLSLLYRFHRARLERERARRTPTLEHVTDAAARGQWEHVRTFSRLTLAGEYRFDAATVKYHPTMSGAFRMTWRLLWPWKQLKERSRRRAANRALRECGFGNLRQFELMQHRAPPEPQPATPLNPAGA